MRGYDADRARVDHQKLQPEDRHYSTNLDGVVASNLLAAVRKQCEGRVTSYSHMLVEVLRQEWRWKKALPSIVPARDSDGRRMLGEWREYQLRRLGNVTRKTRGEASVGRNVWAVLLRVERKWKALGQEEEVSEAAQRVDTAVRAASRVTKVLHAALPAGLEDAPQHEGSVPFAIHERGNSTPFIVDTSGMEEQTQPVLPFASSSLASWWDAVQSTEGATVGGWNTAGLTRALARMYGGKARAASGVGFISRADIKKAGMDARVHTETMPAVVAHHTQSHVLVDGRGGGDPGVWLLTARGLAACFGFAKDARISRGLSAVSDAEGRAMIANGVDAAGCMARLNAALAKLGWSKGQSITAAGLCDGVGTMMACLCKLTGRDLAIGFMSDVAVSAELAVQAGFGDKLGSFFRTVHADEDVAGMIAVGELDLLIAGFPCTPLSSAQRRPMTDDDRREDLQKLMNLMYAALRHAEAVRPRCVLLETVGALRVGLDMRCIFLQVETVLCARLPGYSWSFVRSNASDTGNRMERDRLWITGMRVTAHRPGAGTA